MRSEFRKRKAFENEGVFNAIRRGIRTQFMGEKIAVVFMGLLIVGISSFVIRKCISAPLVDSWIFVLIGGGYHRVNHLQYYKKLFSLL